MVLVLFVGLFFVRLVLPSQIDDVTPGIFCEEEYLDLADVYYVIPKFKGVEIDEEWCGEMKKRASSSECRLPVAGCREKEIAMHGIYHTYNEFGVFRDIDYFDEGVEIFEECFGVLPERFKSPQLAFAEENGWIRDRMEVDLFWNQVFHKVYHCSDTGILPNWLIRIY